MLIHPQFDPIAVAIGPIAVRWYGLMYMVGFLCFMALGRSRATSASGWSAKDIDDLLFYGVLGVVIGGRLGQVLFYEPGYYLAHPLEIPAVWKGGMSFHGGFLGVLVAMAWFGRKTGRELFARCPFRGTIERRCSLHAQSYRSSPIVYRSGPPAFWSARSAAA